MYYHPQAPHPDDPFYASKVRDYEKEGEPQPATAAVEDIHAQQVNILRARLTLMRLPQTTAITKSLQELYEQYELLTETKLIA